MCVAVCLAGAGAWGVVAWRVFERQRNKIMQPASGKEVGRKEGRKGGREGKEGRRGRREGGEVENRI